MSEREFPKIQITDDDIVEANRLSLHCPICASAVENNLDGEELKPVICGQCGTLYHKLCWEQSGGKCAVLGCEHEEFRVYGHDYGPALKVNYADLRNVASNGSGPGRTTRRLKDEQRRQVEQIRTPGLWQRLWQWLLDQIKIGLDSSRQ